MTAIALPRGGSAIPGGSGTKLGSKKDLRSKRAMPPPPPSGSTPTSPPTAPPPGGSVMTKSTDVTKIGPILTEATNATNELGKKAIGEGGFKADLSIGNDMDKLIEKNISDRLAGRNPSFSDEIMSMQKEKLFRETQGQTRRGRMALMADAARRGVFRSEATGTLVRDVELAGIQQYSAGVKDLMIEKARMDHEDMTMAVRDGQQWLQGLRQYSLGLEQNSVQREQVKATLAAAAMSAAATMYAADQGLKGSRAVAGASRAAADQAHQDSRAVGRDDAGNVFYKDHSMQQEIFLQEGRG